MYAIISIISTLVILNYASCAHEDVPRFFTNGHGGNQFFHAALGYHSEATRRIDNDNDIEFSHNVKYIAMPMNSTKVTSAPETVKIKSDTKVVEKVFSKRILSEQSGKVSNDVVQDLSVENQIIPEVSTTMRIAMRQRIRRPFFRRITTPLPVVKKSTTTMVPVARKRIVVRKFVPQQKTTQQPEKNKKREISSATSTPARNNLRQAFKFTNRDFKPLQQEQQKHKMLMKNNTQLVQNNRSALYARKPNGKYTQMHFRRVELPSTTTETSTSNGSMHRMKEKRHLANIRFFNRRKLRS